MDSAEAERVVALGLRTVMAGDLDEADALFVAVLQSFPDHATA